MAVSAVHLQRLDSAYHEVVARYAEAVKGSVFSYVKSVARAALMHANDSGRKLPKICDIEAAIRDLLPAAETEAEPASSPKSRKAKISASEVFRSTRAIAPAPSPRLDSPPQSAVAFAA